MKRILILLAAGFMLWAFTAQASAMPLSGMKIKITSKGHTATFQLYDTQAAKELFDQLPLTLELSYYAPWGDAFMLYKDFYAGDQMHRLRINLTGKEEIEKMSGKATIEKIETGKAAPQAGMTVKVTANGDTTVFRLNNSTAARQLYAQLPMNIKVEDYGSNEKIFYPPRKLPTGNTPKADAKAGTLAYYAPWGDVVMFYDHFGSAAGLYELGHAVSGSGHIKKMSGTIQIEKKTP